MPDKKIQNSCYCVSHCLQSLLLSYYHVTIEQNGKFGIGSEKIRGQNYGEEMGNIQPKLEWLE